MFCRVANIRVKTTMKSREIIIRIRMMVTFGAKKRVAIRNQPCARLLGATRV